MFSIFPAPAVVPRDATARVCPGHMVTYRYREQGALVPCDAESQKRVPEYVEQFSLYRCHGLMLCCFGKVTFPTQI